MLPIMFIDVHDLSFGTNDNQDVVQDCAGKTILIHLHVYCYTSVEST